MTTWCNSGNPTTNSSSSMVITYKAKASFTFLYSPQTTHCLSIFCLQSVHLSPYSTCSCFTFQFWVIIPLTSLSLSNGRNCILGCKVFPLIPNNQNNPCAHHEHYYIWAAPVQYQHFRTKFLSSSIWNALKNLHSYQHSFLPACRKATEVIQARQYTKKGQSNVFTEGPMKGRECATMNQVMLGPDDVGWWCGGGEQETKLHQR